jgi:hypothetical protein
MIGIMGGCSSARTYSDQVQGADFSVYKTYAWLPLDKGDTTAKAIMDNEITYQNIIKAADEAMAERGYVLDTKNPDVLLKAHTMFEKERDVVRSPLYSSYNYYYYPGSPTGLWNPYYYNGYYNAPYVTAYDLREIEYIEGRIVIDVIDRQKKRLMWRGWSEEEIVDQKDVDDLYESVEDIFKKYPVHELKAKK